MKKKLSLLFLLLVIVAKAQIINFSDANFKAKLLSSSPSNTVAKDLSGNYFAIDADGDGEISINEAKKIKELNISNANIFSINEISIFSYLELLNCSYNQISTINTSTLPLTEINCSHNQITSLILDISIKILNCSYNQITNINVKNQPLISLNCSNNPLSEINLQDRRLQNISLLNLNNTNITSICKNEGDILPNTGSISQLVCNGAVLGIDAGLKAKLLQATYNVNNQLICDSFYWDVKDTNNNCVDLDPDKDGELTQTDLNKVGYINFIWDASVPNISYNDNFVTTAGINHLVNLKGLEGNIASSYSNTYGILGNIEIDGLPNLEYIDLMRFFVGSVKIKNTPKLNNIKAGHRQVFTPSINSVSCEFENCPLLEKVDITASNVGSITFQNCPTVKYIDLSGNKLSSFNAASLMNLEELYLGNSKYFSNIYSGFSSPSPSNITNLDLSNHTNLKFLMCNYGSLTSLNLQNCTALQLINCSGNEINSLQLQGVNSLDYYGIIDPNYNATLNISGNKLVQLDLNNSVFYSVKADGNLLTTLLLKNGYDEIISFNNNPNLAYICADDSQLSDVQTSVSQYGYTSTCNINTYCSFVPGGSYNTITGLVRFDENNNGCDTNDEIFEHMKLKISDGTTGETFVKNNGKYDFYIQAGNFTVTAEPENPALFTVTPATFSTSFPNNNNNIFTQDLCVTKNGNANDLEVVIAPLTNAVPGFDAKYKVMWRNKGNTILSGNVTFTFNDSKMDFVSSALPSAVSGNQITFNFTNLKPYANTASEVTFNIHPPTHPTNPANAGDQLSFMASLGSVPGDINPADNTFNYQQTVINSFDPNDIVCLQGNTIPAAMIGNYLHYIVNFENSGTAPATNIVVEMDIDPADFDISSLQLQNASHLAYTKVTGNKVEFMMKSANLGSGGHGNILLKMKSKGTLNPGDQLMNRANIYFDYNFPIETNDAITNIAGVLKVEENLNATSAEVYPNPTKGEVNINTESEIKAVEVYDNAGRIIQKQIGINACKTVLTIRSENNGVFYLKIITDKGSMMKKAIKN
jgi:uncharacterized repeat protein (TIGR01451 family)